MPLLVIYNPVCGDGTAQTLFEKEVLPLLQRNGQTVDKFVGTESAKHAGQLVTEFLEKNAGQVTVILGSGDGTLHDIITELSATELKGVRAGLPPAQIHFVLVPCGTANALYSSTFPPPAEPDVSYKLKSVQSFIDKSKTIALTLAISTLSSPPSAKKRPTATVAAVVVSTSLHASILHDSDSLRASMPGMDRFKVAAKNNSTRWYNAAVKLLPASSTGLVELYDPSTKSFIPHPDADDDDPIVDIYGPFAYFLSTVNVDRLEPAFRITPLASDIPSTSASCDVVIVRPLRDPTIDLDTEETREAFAPKLFAVLSAAYKNGSHVGLLYDDKGEIVSEGDGPMVVEYIRCGGWEWIPDDTDEAAHRICSDGAISIIETDGRAVCAAAIPDPSAGFMVYA
ncbi:ATP-NAD kinase-like domain-containing protein [Mycena floridula]|nr:ATP-NAD kinase-like domain-containing protein [Mycena floridula]